MNFQTYAAIVAAGVASALVAPVYAQSATTFTYQGHLSDSGSPADGMYEFQVRLLDGSGTQIGTTQQQLADVSEGMFMLDLDYGPSAFDGSARFLEIGVRSVMSGGAYIILSPNTSIASAPVAQFALDGNEGPQGPQGIQGDQGPQGPQGPQGNTGPQDPRATLAPKARRVIRGQPGPKGHRVLSARPARPAGSDLTTSPLALPTMLTMTPHTPQARGYRSAAPRSPSLQTPLSRA